MAVAIFCCVPAYVNGGAVCEYVLIQGSISFNNQVVSKIVESTCRVFALTLAPQKVNSSKWDRQGWYRLWNARKTMGFLKGNPIYGKTMELSKTAVPMEKLCDFRFGGKKCMLFFKKLGENTSGLRNLVVMFVASVIISLGLVLRTSRATPLAY